MKKRMFFAVMFLVFACVLQTVCGQSNESEPQVRIGIIGAMDEEISLLKDAAGVEKTTTIAGMDFYEGILEGKNVVIVKCGVGKVNAALCADTLINHFGCTMVINTGVAGSLDNQIDIGDIVVSVDAVQHDMNAESLGFQKGEIPYMGLLEIPADEAMRAAAVEAIHESVPDVHVFEGRVCTGDQFISSQEQKEAIKSSFGGLCCEMEGASIAQVCYLNNIPFVIIRAISDKADDSGSVDYGTFVEEAAVNSALVVQNMLEKL